MHADNSIPSPCEDASSAQASAESWRSSQTARRVWLTGIAASLFGISAGAETLTVERLFAEPSLAGESAAGVQLSPDGKLVTFTRPAPGDPESTILWAMSVTGGAPQQILNSRSLGVASSDMTEEQMKFLERRHLTNGAGLEYRWESTGKRVLVSYNADLFLADVHQHSVKQLTRTDASELDPQIAPGGQYVSFVRDRMLHILNVASGKDEPVAADASDTVSYGTAEFVAQEEIQRFTGAWWAPDGGRLAYTRVDESGVQVVPRIRIGSNSTSVVNERYPVTGTANAVVRLFVRVASGGAPVEVDLGAEKDIYLFNAAWSKDARTLYVLRQSRDQRELDLLAVDPSTGSSRVILSEKSKSWVDLERDFRPLRGGNFLWGSTRTGWRHLYLYDHDGRLIRPVTAGAWRIANVTAAAAPDFASVVGVDESRGEVYFVASIDTPIERHLYRISYRRPDQPHQITTGKGWWTPTMAADTPHGFVAQYSDPTTPPQTALYALSGKRIAWLAENKLDIKHPYFKYLDHRPSYEFGTLKAANGADLHYTIMKPADFDANKKYPVIVRVYGGPGVQTVHREWRSLSEQLLTQAGYVLFQMDNRGSANRDEVFEHANDGELGIVNTEDQLAGVRYLRGLPFVDPDRVGMMGWSFGGYITVRAMTTPGSGIRAGAAGGVPSDFSLYDTHYMERYLGKPQAHAAAYHECALLPRLKDLHGELLIAHGLSDDNVVLQNLTALIGELEQRGKTFDLAVYPGQSHGLRGEKTLVHLWKTYLRFFGRSLANPQLPSDPEADRTD